MREGVAGRRDPRRRRHPEMERARVDYPPDQRVRRPRGDYPRGAGPRTLIAPAALAAAQTIYEQIPDHLRLNERPR